ncbi:hypothetical protein [Acidimangrovimonas sediminis]|uniref:hypothetical protein n=1 Tax=Acidimangrovimonas sediminis TaxID=2056283 RepID=UPI000C8096DC|nr:hypothetical protein [Acidimangrovimonas sediminis]
MTIARILLSTISLALALAMPLRAGAELFPPGPAPLAAVPAGIRVTLILPPGVSLSPGSAVLTVAAGGAKADLPLSEPVPAVPDNGGARHLLQPTPGGIAALQAFQAQFAGTQPPASSMQMRLGLCRTDDTPPELPFLLAIRLAPGAPVLPLAAPGAGLSAITGAPPSALVPCP